jgi:hypothetical protein
VLPRRLGVRFALEALFLVALAVAAGLAHLRPLYIVGVMAVAWLLVALAELTASRIERSPVSYLLPEPVTREDEEGESDRIFHPRPEERTVVAPPAELAPSADEQPAQEPQPAPQPEPAPEPEPAEKDESALEDEDEAAEVVAASAEPAEEVEPEEPADIEPEEQRTHEPPDDELETPRPKKRRFGLRRRSREIEPEPAPPPRHVKLLPRRSTPEPSRASKEVAELFGSSGVEDEERVEPKETGT